MEKLTVTAHLATPVVFGGGYLTLDALLAALIFERTGDVDAAHGTIPLARTNGLFHGSAALFEPIDSRRVSFVANLRAAHALDPDLLKKKDGKVHRKLDLKRRQGFGAVMNGYTAFDAPEIVWYAEGDGATVERLLDGAPFIGKRRGSGFGEVRCWSVVDGGDWDGVVGPFGAPLRPVPVEMFAGDRSALKVEAAWRPAYWHPENRTICHAPEAVA